MLQNFLLQASLSSLSFSLSKFSLCWIWIKKLLLFTFESSFGLFSFWTLMIALIDHHCLDLYPEPWGSWLKVLPLTTPTESTRIFKTKTLESLLSNRNVRLLQKSTQTLAKEAALKDAEKIRASKSKFFVTYRSELLRYWLTSFLCYRLC